METIKITCGCGQRYAFDVEPGSPLTSAIHCPQCGVDGTAAANEMIAARTAAAAPPIPPPQNAGGGLKINRSESSPVPTGVRVDSRALGLVEPETAKAEARAKILWGDTPEAVARYLMLQGFSAADASAVVKDLYQERLKELRIKGLKKITIGAGLIVAAVIGLGTLAYYRLYMLKVMALILGMGAWGCWLVLTGCLIVLAPKMESGDVTD